ncbi:unnamed protein product, partial [Meganyctiphanes norvegica]
MDPGDWRGDFIFIFHDPIIKPIQIYDRRDMNLLVDMLNWSLRNINHSGECSLHASPIGFRDIRGQKGSGEKNGNYLLRASPQIKDMPNMLGLRSGPFGPAKCFLSSRAAQDQLKVFCHTGPSRPFGPAKCFLSFRAPRAAQLTKHTLIHGSISNSIYTCKEFDDLLLLKIFGGKRQPRMSLNTMLFKYILQLKMYFPYIPAPPRHFVGGPGTRSQNIEVYFPL